MMKFCFHVSQVTTEGIPPGTVSLLDGDTAYLLREKGNYVSTPHGGILFSLQTAQRCCG